MLRSTYYSVRMRASRKGMHISGAEGLYLSDEISRVVKEYTSRAISHERGMPDDINLSVDKIAGPLISISSLPLCTVNTLNSDSAKNAAQKILSLPGISRLAVIKAFKLISARGDFSGAFLMDKNGNLLQEKEKSIRVSRIGITRQSAVELSRKLGRRGINNSRVKEALILASKVQQHPAVLGELCISDDPGYTTGYAASSNSGYARLPNIKKKGDHSGGRVIFVKSKKITGLLNYLKNEPVIINKISACKGKLNIFDVAGH